MQQTAFQGLFFVLFGRLLVQFKRMATKLRIYIVSTFILYRETLMATQHRKVIFPSENEEYRGYQVLFDKGSPISYLGDRRYIVSEDDCKVLQDNGVKYQVLDS
jgi:hypothetical protein